MSLNRILLTLFVLVGITSNSARAWWDKEWTTRRQITIDTAVDGAAITGEAGSSVVLLRLHDGTFQFTAAKDDGSDIRILADDDKTVLPMHIERFEGVLNEGFVWVKVPTIKPGGKTTLWIYYGNQAAPSVADSKATFEAETQLVYHFGEKGAPAADASGKGNVAKQPMIAVTGSLIGGGARLDGRSAMEIPGSDTLAWAAGSPLTCSIWIKPANVEGKTVILSRKDGANSFVLGVDAGTPFVEINGTRASAAKAIEGGSWHHVAVVAETGKTTLYVDGEAATPLTSSIPALRESLLIGAESAEGANGFAGEVDELNITKAAHSEAWVKLAALSQGSGDKAAKIIVLGADEESGGGGGGGGHAGYFTVIVNSLTVDGWVVIGILGVMLVVSWWVMYAKIRYLNGLSHGNAMFMKQWTEVVNDLTVLDHGSDAERTKSLGGRFDKKTQRKMRESSVYRIYHIGVEEIRHRLAADHEMRILSARSIQSIRASLDGALIREKQIIDKLIVLLTICISGGPFLGLLGTVVGVMITFAAVAAAGDVNVNAIAPGIAAALLATVAGLAVAIPSLFGYNYILSRVKDAVADMHVFIDEFVTRMAEFYAEPERPVSRKPATQIRSELSPQEYVAAHV